MRLIQNPWTGLDGYNCFGCCPTNPIGLQMRFYEDGDDIVSIWHPNLRYQSWINTIHGGVQAVLLDEVCGWMAFHKLQLSGVTAKMDLRYRRPMLGSMPFIEARAHLVERRRNLAVIHGQLSDNEGNILVEADCTYFLYSESQMPQEVVAGHSVAIGEELTREEVIERELNGTHETKQ
ncbi:MAG: PaaI family thioesterase [Paludibacteraceae bacterium]|nr:PaaI family thioesterase [Paludibacteraceae bacterium]